MRIALLSDIHGRIDALEIAYSHAIQRSDTVVCLGDIQSNIEDSTDCIDFIRKHNIPAIRGNHDEDWLMYCSVSQWKTESFQFLKNLPTWTLYNGIFLVHDDPILISTKQDAVSTTEYLLTQEQATTTFESAEVFSNGAQTVVIGHSHVPAVFTTAGVVEIVLNQQIVLPKRHSAIINPGTVGGRPRSHWGSTYAILDLLAGAITYFPLELPKVKDPLDDFFSQLSR